MSETIVKTRRPSSWKRGPLVLLAMLLAFIGFGIFRVMQAGNRAEAETDALLNKLRAGGDAVSITDLAQVHASYAQNGNAAPQYEEVFAVQPVNIPFKMDSKSSAAPPKNAPKAGDLLIDEPLPEEMATHYRSFIETNQVYYARVDALKRAPRFAVEPLNFQAGPNMLLPHVAKYKQTVITLKIRCYWNIHQNNVDAALDDLALIVKVNDALAPEHILICHLVRQACVTIGVRVGERLLNLCTLTEAQLARLQEIFREYPGQKDLRNALVGERVFGLQAFTMPAAIGGAPIGIQPGSSAWHQDRLLYTQLMTELVDATAMPVPEALRAVDSLEKEMFARLKPSSQVMNWINFHVRRRYVLTGMLVPGLTTAIDRAGDAAARVHLLTTAAAVEQFRLKHGKLPNALDEIGADPQFSVDPFTGKPLQYRATNDGFLLYSVGRDRVDNNGTPPKSEVKRINEDIVFTVRTEKIGR